MTRHSHNHQANHGHHDHGSHTHRQKASQPSLSTMDHVQNLHAKQVENYERCMSLVRQHKSPAPTQQKQAPPQTPVGSLPPNVWADMQKIEEEERPSSCCSGGLIIGLLVAIVLGGAGMYFMCSSPAPGGQETVPIRQKSERKPIGIQQTPDADHMPEIGDKFTKDSVQPDQDEQKFTKDSMNEDEDFEEDSEMMEQQQQQPKRRGNAPQPKQEPQTPKFDSNDLSKVGQLHVEIENGEQVYYKIKKKWLRKKTKKVKMSEKDLNKYMAKQQNADGGGDESSDRRRRLMMRLANAEAKLSA